MTMTGKNRHRSSGSAGSGSVIACTVNETTMNLKYSPLVGAL
jgi:hypothetical protein